MHAAAVEVLVHKGGFNPQIALAIAEAMDMTLSQADLVTVPVLDQRIGAVRSEVRELKAEMNVRFEALEQRMDTRFEASDERREAMFRAHDQRMEAMFEASDERVEAMFKGRDVRMEAMFKAHAASMDVKLEKFQSRLILWMIALTGVATLLPTLLGKASEAMLRLF